LTLAFVHEKAGRLLRERRAERVDGVYVDLLLLVGAPARAELAPDRASSSSVLQAKFVSTPRSRANPVTLAGGWTAAACETTINSAAGLAWVADWAEAAGAVPAAAANVVATANTARRRGLALVRFGPPSRRPTVAAACAAGRSLW
jgi:hypothetical protein